MNLKPQLAAEIAVIEQYNQVQTRVAALTADLAITQSLLGKHAIPSTLQSRSLASANPAFKNTFNARRTRAQLEAMSVFAETAMRFVGDVYANDIKLSDAKKAKADADLKDAQLANNPAAIAAAQTALAAATAERQTLDSKRIAAHALVGGLTAALGGADPVSGAIGGATGKLVTLELDKLIADSNWAKANPTAATLLKTLSATAAGSLVGGSAGGFVASNGDRFNRQLHPKIQAFLTKRTTVEAYLAAQRQAGRVLSEGQARDELFTAGAVLNDATVASILDSANLAAAKAWRPQI